MPEGSKLVESLKNVGSRFAFEMAIEVFYDDIIEGLQKFLAGYSKEDIKNMIGDGEFPYIDPNGFEHVRGYEKYLVKITAERLAEAIATARPDLAEALVEAGEEGGKYIHKLRTHLLDMILNPQKSHEQGDTLIQTSPPKMKLVTCLECEQKFPVAEEDLPNLKECPFCHAPVDKPSSPSN